MADLTEEMDRRVNELLASINKNHAVQYGMLYPGGTVTALPMGLDEEQAMKSVSNHKSYHKQKVKLVMRTVTPWEEV